MPVQLGLLQHEVLRWRLAGAAVWQLAVLWLAAMAWTALRAGLGAWWLSPAAWLLLPVRPATYSTLIGLAVAMLPAFATQAAVVSTAEPPPRYFPRLAWPRVTVASVLLHQLLARAWSPSVVVGAARLGAYLALHTLSALLFLSLDAALHGGAGLGPAWMLHFSVWLALAQLMHTLYWNTDVLVFPSIQRHRYFRIKQRLPWAASRALQLASVAFAAATLTCTAAGQLGGSSGARGLLRLAAAPAPAVAALLAGALCAFGWLSGAAVLEVVLTERLRPDDYCNRDVLGAMATCLSGAKGPVMRDLALHDLSLLATADVATAAWRRQEVWADESGERWKPLGEACLAQLAAVQRAAAAALPQGAVPAPAGGSASAATGGQGQARRWNVLPAMSVRGRLGVNRPQAEALLALRASYQRVKLATRALSGLAAASLREDRFGLLQLSRPGLGEATLALLVAAAEVRGLLRALGATVPRSLAALGPWRGAGDAPAGAAGGHAPAEAPALALQDELTTALYSLTATFGDSLRKVVAEAKAPEGAPAARRAEATKLLDRLLQAEE